MSEWHAYIEDDDEGNVCIWIQDGDDRANRELHDMVERDVKASLPGQEDDYLAEAEEEAERRNSGEDDDDD